MKNKFIENLKTLIYALLIAVFIRSLLIQPFYIPSSSMEPTLLIGDRIFVSKLSYGYSNHSFPFSPTFFNDRLFNKKPDQGDLVVFKTPADNRTDYIKRLIGMPGDKIQFKNGDLFINDEKIPKKKVNSKFIIKCGPFSPNVEAYEETLPNGKTYLAVYNSDQSLQNTDLFIVPDKHYFLLGDNRDCSKDSRFLTSVGYVNEFNLVGKAKMIFFSNDTEISSFLKFWNWKDSIRLNRFFKFLK